MITPLSRSARSDVLESLAQRQTFRRSTTDPARHLDDLDFGQSIGLLHWLTQNALDIAALQRAYPNERLFEPTPGCELDWLLATPFVTSLILRISSLACGSAFREAHRNLGARFAAAPEGCVIDHEGVEL